MCRVTSLSDTITAIFYFSLILYAKWQTICKAILKFYVYLLDWDVCFSWMCYYSVTFIHSFRTHIMKPQVFSLGNVSREREKKIYEEQLDVLLSLWISHSTTYVGGILIFHLIPKCFVSSIVRYSHYAKENVKWISTVVAFILILKSYLHYKLSLNFVVTTK